MRYTPDQIKHESNMDRKKKAPEAVGVSQARMTCFPLLLCWDPEDPTFGVEDE